MNYPMRSYRIKPAFWLTIIAFGFTGCSTKIEIKDRLFEPNQVSAILFNFENIPDSFETTLPEENISSRVADNLAAWGYPVKAKTTEAYSHTLTTEIGPVKHDSTPVGFSFSSGNSDPRAVDFQKTNVIPITCLLKPKEKPEISAELSMGFTADSFLSIKEQTGNPKNLVELLVNDISTVCFNLLSKLEINTQLPKVPESTKKSEWIPQVRVEVENAVKPDGQKLDSPPQNVNTDEPRKQIIIHNQGSPVIFKFGHERK